MSLIFCRSPRWDGVRGVRRAHQRIGCCIGCAGKTRLPHNTPSRCNRAWKERGDQPPDLPATLHSCEQLAWAARFVVSNDTIPGKIYSTQRGGVAGCLSDRGIGSLGNMPLPVSSAPVSSRDWETGLARRHLCIRDRNCAERAFSDMQHFELQTLTQRLVKESRWRLALEDGKLSACSSPVMGIE